MPLKTEVVVGIDVGKTNLRVGLFTPALTLLDRWSTSALDPVQALESLAVHLAALQARYQPLAAGISTFGPLETDPHNPIFGAIHRSSAPLWSGINLPKQVRAALHVPVFFDYDVNAGALAESRLGAAAGLASFVYLSVGTGIGAVAFRSGVTPGYAPQLGHIALPREPDDLAFPGSCRFHGGCLQGLASGLALAERWGIAAEHLPADHPGWDLEARYLARACANFVYTFAPQRILLASSVARAPGLVLACNRYLRVFLNGFLDPATEALYAAQDPILQAALTPDSSLLGAAVMAAQHVGLSLP